MKGSKDGAGKESRTKKREGSLGLSKRLHPFLGPEQASASTAVANLRPSATITDVQTKKRNPENTSEIQKENARQEKRHKKDGGMQYRSARSNPSGSTVGMIRGKRLWKRSYEELEQWMDNEISFPSVPRCRLVDSPIILEALIE
ncbi:hypothetical protein Tco_0198696, partial [Tanacetum coccineum]